MSTKQKRIVWPMIALLTLTLTAVAFVTTHNKTMASPKADREPTAASKPSSAIPASAPEGAVQVVRFTVYPEGIKPREAHATAGRVAIYVEDLGGVSAGLVIQNSLRARLGQVSRVVGGKRGSIRLNLAAGQYTIFDSTRQQVQATLIVE